MKKENDKIFGMAIGGIKYLVYSLTYSKHSETNFFFSSWTVKSKNSHAPVKCLAWFVIRIELLVVLILSMCKALDLMSKLEKSRKMRNDKEGKRIKRRERIHNSDAN